ncbi:Queuosine Biosynthesis QueC ATPase [hydrothermal vent metagenome]|uniref:7-cyano-7-deazaguanine synthase n=1 Tax=hydrothermal vent metagenome TaxID=652676 RepID=A0A1W1CIJ2_9ZZZZ
MKKAIVLLSGGLDSTTCLAIAKSKNYEIYAISFDYGQKQKSELDFAKINAKKFEVKKHWIVNISLGDLGNSALTDKNIEVPDFSNNEEIPVTYVPARNTIFLSYALAYAEVVGASDIFIGVNSVDYSGYPDCRPEYIASFQKLANLATKQTIEGLKIKINTPLINLDKSEIIELGLSLKVDYQKTISCYKADNNGNACGKCDACVLRKKGFKKLLKKDPTMYI